jgi:hypothetical protein
MRAVAFFSLLTACGAVAATNASANPPTNPFCGWASTRGTIVASLACENGVIDAIPLALYGTPTGSCPAFSPSACNDKGFSAFASAQCLGQRACDVSTNTRPDPCPEVVKTVAIVAHCSLPPGGVTPPPPAPPPPTPQPPVSPTCALNGFPCPPPRWEPTWNLTESTVIQPSSEGYFMPNHTWGLISLDWSVARSVWFAGGNRSNTTCEATSVEGCRRLKAAGRASKCFICESSSRGGGARPRRSSPKPLPPLPYTPPDRS